MDWIDLALRDDEAGIAGAIDALDQTGRLAAFASVAELLGLSLEEIERAALRLLIERARPLALPTLLWSRPVTASDDPASLVQAHFKRKGIEVTPDRLRRALRLYAQFAEERDNKTPVTEAGLQQCGFRCQHCGLAFCNEDLATRAIVSPFGYRGSLKSDSLKPHWNDQERFRYPTMDHHWPVSLYGDNRHENLKILCQGCNQGKENYLALAQMRSSVGLPGRTQFFATGPLAWEAFYAQLRREPACVLSGKAATEVELTIRLKDPYAPAVLDNLETVESPGQ